MEDLAVGGRTPTPSPGLRVCSLGLRVKGFGFRVQGLGFRDSGVGPRVSWYPKSKTKKLRPDWSRIGGASSEVGSVDPVLYMTSIYRWAYRDI